MNSQHDKRIGEMMVSSRRKVEDYINDVTGTLTDALRELYKEKKVNCVCYELFYFCHFVYPVCFIYVVFDYHTCIMTEY